MRWKPYSSVISGLKRYGVEFKTLEDMELVRQRATNAQFQHLVCERMWSEERKPYYNVFPSIYDAMVKSSLKIPVITVMDLMMKNRVPPVILIRFREDADSINTFLFQLTAGPSKATVENYSGIKTMGEYHQKLRRGEVPIESLDLQCNVYMHGEFDEFGNASYLQINGVLPMSDITSTIESMFTNLTNGSGGLGHLTPEENEKLQKALRVSVCLILLANDKNIVVPEVLEKHMVKFETTQDLSLVEKAVNRGKRGWSVGKNVEVRKSAHWRKPHFAIRWTGKGRTVPKITLISGCTVNREDITKVPTGYFGEG